MESPIDKIENEIEHLYEYVEHTSGDKQLAVKLAIKLIENEYIHENTIIIYDPLLVDLLEESRLHKKTLESLEKQTFFKSFASTLVSPVKETDVKSEAKPLSKILSNKHSVLDYFSVSESTKTSDKLTDKKSEKIVPKTEIITLDVESMPKKADSTTDKISHIGGSSSYDVGSFAIYCDGACKNNGKRNARAGYGLSVQYNNKEVYLISKALEDSESHTNQRAELRALSDALEITYKKITYLSNKLELKIPIKKVHIYSDSEYSINCLTKWAPSWSKRGWRKADGKEVLHVDIIKPMFEEWTKWNMYTGGLVYDIQIHHVRSHTGKTDPISLGNERADELAVLSIS